MAVTERDPIYRDMDREIEQRRTLIRAHAPRGYDLAMEIARIPLEPRDPLFDHAVEVNCELLWMAERGLEVDPEEETMLRWAFGLEFAA